MTAGVDRHELRQIIAGLSEGVILVEPDQTIAYANEAALAMHGAESLDEIGPTVDAYRARFALRYRNKRAPESYPIERVVAGVARNVHYASGFWTRNFEWGGQEALSAVVVPRDPHKAVTLVAPEFAKAHALAARLSG